MKLEKKNIPPREHCGTLIRPRRNLRGKTLCPPCRRVQIKLDFANGLIPPEDCHRFNCKHCLAENLYPLELLSGRNVPAFCDGFCRSKFHNSSEAQQQRRASAVIPSKTLMKTESCRPSLRDTDGFSNFRSRNCGGKGRLCRHYLSECFAGADFRPRDLKGGCYEEPEERGCVVDGRLQAINAEARAGSSIGRWNKSQMAR